MTFHEPSYWLLVLLILSPLVWWRYWSSRRRSAMVFSDVRAVESAGATWAVRFRWIVPCIRTLVIILLIISIARPRRANEQTRITTEGIAIQLLIDRSGSMRALDFELNGQRTDRMAAAKDVAERFIVGDEELPGRPNDLIGLLTFALYADSTCPLTLDHERLATIIRETDVAAAEEGRATAIGDAIALGVERIRNAKRGTEGNNAHRITSRIMILLTDGVNNAGDIDPITAAHLAAKFDIRIYTIGAGSDAFQVPVPVMTRRGREVIDYQRVPLDEKTLQRIAEITGGRYFRATDTESLSNVYARIDELEKTEIEQTRYLEFSEWAIEPVEIAGSRMPPLILIALILLVAEVLLSTTRFRTLP